jgi:gamma-glutamyltranspeptidase/glutathione hydrolase
MIATKNKVAVATTSRLAAEAAAEIADLGGNAVDCGIAAAMCSINTQPGVCALAGSAFVTIWIPGQDPITIDGNVCIPGIGCPPEFEPVPESVELHYGGGIETLVGPSSVAVPGALAALYRASADHGKLPWLELLQPTIRAARSGFPLSAAAHYFLRYAGDSIYGRSNDGHGALHDADGGLLDVGSTITVPHLADSLAAIAEEGERIFYAGDIGQLIVEHVRSGGGMLTMEDFRNYTPFVRKALLVQIGAWQFATNPPPAIGGANLAAMLLGFGTGPLKAWDQAAIRRLVNTQAMTMRFRHEHLDFADDVSAPVAEMLRLATSGEMISRYSSASTVHTSAVDRSGTGCAITASSGYGSGEMPAGSGLWLNNCLGELELNRHGLRAGPPGKRLPSNMAPSVARSRDAVIAIGSPGADRITTALHQFLVNFLQLGLELDKAIAHPRVHLKIDGSVGELAAEPGIQLPQIEFGVKHYESINMYFGGVVAALYDNRDGFNAAADPRREGGTYIGPQD